MRRRTKWVSAGLLACLLTGLINGSGPVDEIAFPAASRAAAGAAGGSETGMNPGVAQALLDAAVQAEQKEPGFVEMDWMAATEKEAASLRSQVVQAGGEVLLQERNYIQAKVPQEAATGLVKSASTASVGFNSQVQANLTELVPVSPTMQGSEAASAAQINLEAIDVPLFRQSTGATGDGVKIAVIDSGIDPGHPDLQQTPGGQPKIVDWKDFTREGRVLLPNEVAWVAYYTAPTDRTYELPDRPASSAKARFGFWEESKVPGRINRDLDRNGSSVDRFGVLAVDSVQTGVYDKVYVDTNNDGSFRDEQPLQLYRQSHRAVRLGPFRMGQVAEQQLAFVLADIKPDGTQLSFGFDSLGHGTQVAGVAAASSGAGAPSAGAQSGLTGVAPEAQLLALKVITSRDEGDWFSIREAIQYAVDQGADVINVSLGGLPISAAYDSAASAWLNDIATRYEVLIIFAAGNTGPGLSSGATLGSPSDILSIGAYYSPAMWKRDYGVVVPSEGVWWRSGMGPRADGSFVPNLIAPGGSPTTSPHWLDPTGYTTTSGTSIAVPHVAGSAALLIELARREGLAHDHRSLRRSLEQGARRLPGVGTFEQGAGLLNLSTAYKELQEIDQVPVLVGKGPSGGDGLYIRAYRPGNDAFTLTNLTWTATRINIHSSERWVQPAFRSLMVGAQGTRQLPLQLDPPTFPGVHSAFLQLLHPDQVVPSVTLPITYLQPVPLNEQNRFSATAELEVARYQRYFVEVKPGAQTLRMSTRVLSGTGGSAMGTVQVQVFRPDGQMLYRSDAIGANGLGLSASLATPQPMAGVWEIVVTALPDATGDHLTASYSLEVEVPKFGAELPLRYSVAADALETVSVPVANPGLPINARVEAVGLTKVDSSQPWLVMKQLYQIDEFTLKESADLLLLEIENATPAESDLDILLYRYDLTRGWQRYWSSQNRQPGRERLQYPNLPAGQYQVYVQYNGTPPAEIQYQYRRSVATRAYNLSAQDTTGLRTTGQTWEVPVKIYAPSEPGRYLGYVILSDADTGESVAWYPMEVSVAQPTLKVEPMLSQLQLNRPGTVVLEMRDGQTNKLVDGPVLVNGQRFLTKQGRVTVPVRPMTTIQSLKVQVDLPSYQYLAKEIRIPVRIAAWAPLSSTGGSSPENELWRRKLQSLLP